VGDHLLMSRFGYDASAMSISSSSVGEPHRQQIVVFRLLARSPDYIKRLIGLPATSSRFAKASCHQWKETRGIISAAPA